MAERTSGGEKRRLPARLAVLGMATLAALGAVTDNSYNPRQSGGSAIEQTRQPSEIAAARMQLAEEIAAALEKDPTGNDPLETRARTAWNYFQAKGLTAAQSAGIVANLYAESAVQPDVEQVGGDGYGLAQWTGTRRGELERFAATTNSDVASLDTQLAFMYEEFSTTYAHALDDLKSQSTAGAAAYSIQTRYLVQPI